MTIPKIEEFYPGDRVICIQDWNEKNYAREGTVLREFCEFGDHMLLVHMDGDPEEVDEEFSYYNSFEHTVDPYEYAVQRESLTRPDMSYIIGNFWTDREDREDFLGQLTRVLPEGVTYKLVKRRKAGPVEDA